MLVHQPICEKKKKHHCGTVDLDHRTNSWFAFTCYLLLRPVCKPFVAVFVCFFLFLQIDRTRFCFVSVRTRFAWQHTLHEYQANERAAHKNTCIHTLRRVGSQKESEKHSQSICVMYCIPKYNQTKPKWNSFLNWTNICSFNSSVNVLFLLLLRLLHASAHPHITYFVSPSLLLTSHRFLVHIWTLFFSQPHFFRTSFLFYSYFFNTQTPNERKNEMKFFPLLALNKKREKN